MSRLPASYAVHKVVDNRLGFDDAVSIFARNVAGTYKLWDTDGPGFPQRFTSAFEGDEELEVARQELRYINALDELERQSYARQLLESHREQVGRRVAEELRDIYYLEDLRRQVRAWEVNDDELVEFRSNMLAEIDRALVPAREELRLIQDGLRTMLPSEFLESHIAGLRQTIQRLSQARAREDQKLAWANDFLSRLKLSLEERARHLRGNE